MLRKPAATQPSAGSDSIPACAACTACSGAVGGREQGRGHAKRQPLAATATALLAPDGDFLLAETGHDQLPLPAAANATCLRRREDGTRCGVDLAATPGHCRAISSSASSLCVAVAGGSEPEPDEELRPDSARSTAS